MENSKIFADIKEADEVRKSAEAYCKLQKQLGNPTREGMIDALKSAHEVAWQEIRLLEHSQGDVIPTPWNDFSNQDLFRKLTQYQQGLCAHAANKFGEEVFKMALREYN